MFKWGILSAAKIAREHLIPAIQSSNNGTVTAIASRNQRLAEATARQFAIAKTCDSYESLLADPEIDGVYIPLYTSAHADWTRKAAVAGKHVLCEKPIAMKAAEVDELVRVRDSHNVLIAEAFMVHYHPQWQKTASLLAKDTIGKLRYVQGGFSYVNTDPKNLRNQVTLGGGALRDIGVYPIVTTRLASGAEPIKLRAELEYDKQFGTDSHANVTIDFGNFILQFYVSTQLALRQSMVFHGDKGFISLSAPFNAGLYDHDRITVHNANHNQQQVFEFPQINQYRLQVEAFVRASADATENILPLESSKRNQAIIDACFRAGKSQSWVDIAL